MYIHVCIYRDKRRRRSFHLLIGVAHTSCGIGRAWPGKFVYREMFICIDRSR